MGRGEGKQGEHHGSAFSRGTSPCESELEGHVAFGNWKLVGQGRTEQGQQTDRDTETETQSGDGLWKAHEPCSSESVNLV